MLTILKDTTKLEIKNVICFYVGFNTKISTAEELKSKKEEDWSYQDYLVDSCAKHEYNLVWFNKATVNYTLIDGVINIDDEITDNHISLTKDNIHDTIIFQGQANDDMDINYEGLMRAFEYMKFFMLNTVDEIKIASDKYLSANLLSAHNIPQPNYVLVTRDLMEDLSTDTKDTRKSFWDIVNKVYSKNTDITDYSSSDIKYVCKILGGSLGIGVFICDKSELESILQAMFQISPSSKFIIQEFKKNTGDIRVHLLSVDGMNYEVLACMKRNKIEKDFRSNVSLGATTDKYKLSKEQEEIVMKTAKASGCRWVGVDLMECEDGSNVVIEYNSSPGVQGISQQIGKNMFDIVFDKINAYLKKYATFTEKGERLKENERECYSIYNPEIVDGLKLQWNELSDNRIAVLNECLKIQPGMYYEKHGKTSPIDGLDCSGYVKYIVKEALNVNMPSMCVKYFNTFDDNNFEPIDESELLPGDIGVKNESTIMNHCGIYAGDGKWFETNVFYGAQLTDCSLFKHFFRIKNIDE
jgi:RimK family alpha-L-glutamate ligase